MGTVYEATDEDEHYVVKKRALSVITIGVVHT
jgi:hypothetical protein